jgi:hypothetical protein
MGSTGRLSGSRRQSSGTSEDRADGVRSPLPIDRDSSTGGGSFAAVAPLERAVAVDGDEKTRAEAWLSSHPL